jgi:hypothetical protein
MKKEISKDIVNDTTLKAGHTYVITNYVRVFAKLTIEDNVNIFILNNAITDTVANGLVFLTSSELEAGEVNFFACDNNMEKINFAYNRGLNFYGSAGRNAYNATPSKFVAKKLRLNYLGGFNAGSFKYDPAYIYGCNEDEWKVKAYISNYSGDEGIVISLSTITFDFISIKYPSTNGMTMFNSIVKINKGLKVINNNNFLFSLSFNQLLVARPLCYIKLPVHTRVYLDGPWGSVVQNIKVVTKSLPTPTNASEYYYNDCTTCGQTYIYPTV